MPYKQAWPLLPMLSPLCLSPSPLLLLPPYLLSLDELISVRHANKDISFPLQEKCQKRRIERLSGLCSVARSGGSPAQMLTCRGSMRHCPPEMACVQDDQCTRDTAGHSRLGAGIKYPQICWFLRNLWGTWGMRNQRLINFKNIDDLWWCYEPRTSPVTSCNVQNSHLQNISS